MRFYNNAPVTLYVVVDTAYGNVEAAFHVKKEAREFIKDNTYGDLVIRTYDQRISK